MSFLIVPIWPWGQINIKRIGNSLFSERNGCVPTLAFWGLRFTWRKWRKG